MCRTRRCWTSLMKLMRRTPIHRSPNWRGSGGGSSFIGRECSGEQRRGHFGVAEHGRPFAEGEVRGDDDAGPLIKLADEVEQQLPSRAGERQITELVEHDQVEPRQLRRQGPAFADPGLLFEACHQPTPSRADPRLEADPLALALLKSRRHTTKIGPSAFARPLFRPISRRSATGSARFWAAPGYPPIRATQLSP